MGLVNLSAKLTASAMVNNMRRHQGDVSEGTQHRPLAVRSILGHRCEFFRDGTHTVDGTEISEEEQFGSEVLRFAHASLLTGLPVGDKKLCWVDASTNPAEVWIHGFEGNDYIRRARALVNKGVPPDFIVDSPLETSAAAIRGVENFTIDVGEL
ncbi:MAG TPA: hypothetical protein VNA25_23795 [Phycisphaerae bacterium]|nr:hypothetical protein [Phycisphaerae bacterium]